MRYQLRSSDCAGNRVVSTHRGVVVGCQMPLLGDNQSSHRPLVEPAVFSVWLNLPGANATMEHRTNGLSRSASNVDLSWGLASLFTGCTRLGRANSPGPQCLASGSRRSTPPSESYYSWSSTSHVARQQAILEDAPCDGVRNQVLQSCAGCGCGVGRRGCPLGGRMLGDRQGVVGPRGRDCWEPSEWAPATGFLWETWYSALDVRGPAGTERLKQWQSWTTAFTQLLEGWRAGRQGNWYTFTSHQFLSRPKKKQTSRVTGPEVVPRQCPPRQLSFCPSEMGHLSLSIYSRSA